MSNSYPLPAPGAAQSLDKVNEELRAMLAEESAARIDARALMPELTQAIVDNDKPGIKNLIRELLHVLS